MSEMCQYWEGFLEIVSILKVLFAADREGNWQVDLQAMQNLLLVFRECDSINYLRYASWYAEKIRKLPQDHPEIYEKFMQGHFVVKQNNGEFNAVYTRHEARTDNTKIKEKCRRDHWSDKTSDI